MHVKNLGFPYLKRANGTTYYREYIWNETRCRQTEKIFQCFNCGVRKKIKFIRRLITNRPNDHTILAYKDMYKHSV